MMTKIIERQGRQNLRDRGTKILWLNIMSCKILLLNKELTLNKAVFSLVLFHKGRHGRTSYSYQSFQGVETPECFHVFYISRTRL